MVEPQTFFQCLFSFVNHLPPRYLISKLFKGTHWKENGSLGNGCLPSLHIYILRDCSRYGQLTLWCKSAFVENTRCRSGYNLFISAWNSIFWQAGWIAVELEDGLKSVVGGWAYFSSLQQKSRIHTEYIRPFSVSQSLAVFFKNQSAGMGSSTHKDLVERVSLWYFSDISIHGFSGFGNGPS